MIRLLKGSFIFILFGGFFTFLVAEDWSGKFNELCAYDKFCKNLKDSDGSFLKPKAEIVLALKELNPVILEAAKMYEIDPRAIAGAILSENSLNVTISDDIQDWLVKLKIAKDGSIFGKKFSFGWGQLYMDAALEAEPLAAKIERRKERNPDDLAQDLLKPDKSIMQVAAVIRLIQENYKEEGFDISNTPELLTTVYNLGGSKLRAQKAKITKTTPKVNYFGFFTLMNKEILGEIVQTKKTQNSSLASANSKKTGFRLNQKISFNMAPPSCSMGAVQDDEYYKTATTKHYPEVNQLNMNKTVQILSVGLGCDLQEWQLVGDSKGDALGWVLSEELKSKSKEIVLENVCTRKVDTSCLKTIQNTFGEQVISNSIEGLVNIKLKGRKKNIDWRQPALDYCLKEEGQNKINALSQKALNDNEIEKLHKGIELFKKKVVDIVSTKENKISFSDAKNPYNFLDNLLSFPNLQGCSTVPIPQSGKNICVGDVDLYLQKLNELEFVKAPAWSELKNLHSKASSVGKLVDVSYDSASPLEEFNKNKDEYLAKMREDVAKCRKISVGSKKAATVLDQIMQDIHPDNIKAMYAINRGYLDQMGEFCNKVNGVADCVDCSNESMTVNFSDGSSGPNYSSSTTSLEKIKIFLNDENDKDEFLYDQFKSYVSMIMNSQMGGGQNTNLDKYCSYLPKETGNQIESVISNSCVKKIFVTDPYLLTRFIKQKDKIMYHAFIEDDRYMIDIGEPVCK